MMSDSVGRSREESAIRTASPAGYAGATDIPGYGLFIGQRFAVLMPSARHAGFQIAVARVRVSI